MAKRIEVASKDDTKKRRKERAKTQIQRGCWEFVPGIETDIVERRRHVDNALWTIYFAQRPRLGASEFTKQHARPFILAPYGRLIIQMFTYMADETKAPQIENPEKITAKELAEMVKQMRHNQRRCQRNPTPEKLATLESWERKVDAVVAVLTNTQMKLF